MLRSFHPQSKLVNKFGNSNSIKRALSILQRIFRFTYMYKRDPANDPVLIIIKALPPIGES